MSAAYIEGIATPVLAAIAAIAFVYELSSRQSMHAQALSGVNG